jgi:hypothetical protein
MSEHEDVNTALGRAKNEPQFRSVFRIRLKFAPSPIFEFVGARYACSHWVFHRARNFISDCIHRAAKICVGPVNASHISEIALDVGRNNRYAR